MTLPELTIQIVPNGDPYPVLICLASNGAPILAVADVGPDFDPEAVGQEIVRGMRAWANLKRYYLDPVETPSTLWECN